MYLLFKYKNILPSSSYNLTYGERVIVNAFLSQEIEERNAEYEEV